MSRCRCAAFMGFRCSGSEGQQIVTKSGQHVLRIMSIVTAAAGNICIYAPAIPNDHTKVCNYTDIQNIMVSILYFLAYHLQVSEQNCGQISNIYLMNTNKITHTHTHTLSHLHTHSHTYTHTHTHTHKIVIAYK